MRQHETPDWGYFGAAWSIVAVGLGFVVMSELQYVGILLTAMGLVLLAYSLRPTIRSLVRRAPQLPGPRVILEGQDAFHVKSVGWQFGETDILSLRLKNSPTTPSESSVARGIGVEFTCEETGAPALPWIQARDDYSPQPSELLPGQRAELVSDLGINKWKTYNLILKAPKSDNCYLFNNDSYLYGDAQNPAWKIGPGCIVF